MSLTQDLTLQEQARLAALLNHAQQAEWEAVHEAPWYSAEYEARFATASELTGIFLDVMGEILEAGGRAPCEDVYVFAARVGVACPICGSAAPRPGVLSGHSHRLVAAADTAMARAPEM